MGCTFSSLLCALCSRVRSDPFVSTAMGENEKLRCPFFIRSHKIWCSQNNESKWVPIVMLYCWKAWTFDPCEYLFSPAERAIAKFEHSFPYDAKNGTSRHPPPGWDDACDRLNVYRFCLLSHIFIINIVFLCSAYGFGCEGGRNRTLKINSRHFTHTYILCHHQITMRSA